MTFIAAAELDKHAGQTGKFACEKMAREVKQMQFDCTAFAICAMLFYRIQRQINNEVSIIAMQYGSSVSKQLLAAVAAAARKRTKNALKVNV